MEEKLFNKLQNIAKKTIEDCYLSTYKRYQSGVEQIDAMHSDIQIIKSVLCEHSKKLQTIS